jgi:hypothetical protein
MFSSPVSLENLYVAPDWMFLGPVSSSRIFFRSKQITNECSAQVKTDHFLRSKLIIKTRHKNLRISPSVLWWVNSPATPHSSFSENRDLSLSSIRWSCSKPRSLPIDDHRTMSDDTAARVVDFFGADQSVIMPTETVPWSPGRDGAWHSRRVRAGVAAQGPSVSGGDRSGQERRRQDEDANGFRAGCEWCWMSQWYVEPQFFSGRPKIQISGLGFSSIARDALRREREEQKSLSKLTMSQHFYFVNSSKRVDDLVKIWFCFISRCKHRMAWDKWVLTLTNHRQTLYKYASLLQKRTTLPNHRHQTYFCKHKNKMLTISCLGHVCFSCTLCNPNYNMWDEINRYQIIATYRPDYHNPIISCPPLDYNLNGKQAGL